VKQAAFEQRHEAEWAEFETCIASSKSKQKAGATAVARQDLPRLYRVLCQHLALARDRHYSANLVDRLNRLAMTGHHALYGAQAPAGNWIRQFLWRDFPRAVRREIHLVTLAGLLFFGPMLVVFGVQQRHSDFIYTLMPASQVAQFEEMYSPAEETRKSRDADSDVLMFGFYIKNNIGIGFQTFAGGILFAVGSVFFLVFNGLIMGAIAGHLSVIGYGEKFWGFVAGHSSFELIAIVLAGATGLRLGAALIAPGRISRLAALRRAGQACASIIYGMVLLFVVAAFIEAFWSPHLLAFRELKIGAGVAAWIALPLYFAIGGRGES
jgi:uncharacterized membrane protein SpoIIM required for sporulation